MTQPSLILIGAGGHARACIDIIEQFGHYQIAGLVGMPQEVNTQHLGYTVIATDNELPELARSYQYAFIAVGQIQSPDLRMHLYQQAINFGFELPSIIAQTALVSRHAVIGAGSIVMHGAIVNAGAEIGNNCIINTRAVVEHDVTIEDHCHISTGVILNGNVKIGTGSFVGSGSAVKEGVSIGKRSVVGMGLCVRHDQADHSRFVGKGET